MVKNQIDRAEHTPRATRIIERCREIARYTEVPGQTTRTFLSPPMHAVHALLRGWMEAAGNARERGRNR